MVVDNELEMMTEKSACFKALFCHLPIGAEGKHKNRGQSSRFSNTDFKPRPPVFKANLLSIQPQH
jgi:hypothetical protein